MQAFGRRENGAVVVYVSAGLSAAGRATAIRRALRAAPEAGWRPPNRPVLIPALAGAVRLRLAPQSRWTYRALFAGAAAAAIVVIAMTAAMALSRASLGPNAGSRPQALAPGAPVGAPADPAGGPARSASGSGPASGGHARRGTKPGTSGQAGQAVQPGAPGAGGSGPAPQTSGQPVPVATTTPAPKPKTSPAPSPSPTKPGGGSASDCITLLGVGICL
jgi:hypothetical protein